MDLANTRERDPAENKGHTVLQTGETVWEKAKETKGEAQIMQAKKNVMRLKLGSTNQLGTADGGTGDSSCLSMTSKPVDPWIQTGH